MDTKITADKKHSSELSCLKNELEKLHNVYQELFEHSLHVIILQDKNGTFKVFTKNIDFLGYSVEELSKLSFADLDVCRTPDKINAQLNSLLKKNKNIHFETRLKTKNKDIRDVHISCHGLKIRGEKFIQNILFDITDRRKEEDSRRAFRDKLNDNLKKRAKELKKSNKNLLSEIEKRRHTEEALRSTQSDLEEKNRTLEDMNATLRILLQRRDEYKDELGKKVMLNVEELIMPSLLELRQTALSGKQRSCIDVLQSNLNDIASSFSQTLSMKQIRFTPVEFKVASFIKQGRSSKEISDYLNISQRTVDWHRTNIRRKLGLDNKRANLKSYLSSLK